MLPAIAVLANLVLAVNVEPGAFLFGLLAEAIGVVIWFGVVGVTSEKTIERETPTVISRANLEDREFQLLVPIANPDHIDQLMRTARDVAATEDGEILVLSVVELPEQTPLSAGREEAEERQAILERAMDVQAGGADAGGGSASGTDADGSENDVPVSGIVRIGHSVDEAIVHTVTQHDSDAILMGWRGRPVRRRDVVVGSTVDTVVQEADCDVLVERIGSEGPPESILLPTAGGPHSEYAAEVARAISRSTGSSITLQHVLPPDADERRRDQASKSLEEAGAILDDVPYETRVDEHPDVVDAIVDASQDHDLTVVGATSEGLLQQLVFGSIPEQVGREAAGTVVMAKRNLGITSYLRQLVHPGSIGSLFGIFR